MFIPPASMTPLVKSNAPSPCFVLRWGVAKGHCSNLIGCMLHGVFKLLQLPTDLQGCQNSREEERVTGEKSRHYSDILNTYSQTCIS